MKYPLHSIIDLQTKGITREHLRQPRLYVRSFSQNTIVKTSNLYLDFSQTKDTRQRFNTKTSAN